MHSQGNLTWPGRALGLDCGPEISELHLELTDLKKKKEKKKTASSFYCLVSQFH